MYTTYYYGNGLGIGGGTGVDYDASDVGCGYSMCTVGIWLLMWLSNVVLDGYIVMLNIYGLH